MKEKRLSFFYLRHLNSVDTIFLMKYFTHSLGFFNQKTVLNIKTGKDKLAEKELNI